MESRGKVGSFAERCFKMHFKLFLLLYCSCAALWLTQQAKRILHRKKKMPATSGVSLIHAKYSA